MNRLNRALLAAALLALLAAGLLLLPRTVAATKAPPPTPTPTPAPAPKSSPEQPLSYGNNWVAMQPGEWHWYAFKYDFDDSGDSRQAPSNIRLDMKPGASATLLLLNSDQVRAWEHGEKLQGFGEATPVINTTRVKVDKSEFCEQNPHDPICDENGNRTNSQCDNLRDPLSTDSTCNFTLREPRGYSTWTGTIGASGTYYVLIRGSSGHAGSVAYKLAAGGDGLRMK